MATQSEIFNDIANMSTDDFAEKYAGVDVSSILESADLNEGRGSSYPLYHDQYTHAINAALQHHGHLHVSDDDRFHHVGNGPRKPSEGQTVSHSIPATDVSGNEHRIHIQVYNKGGKKPYELNTYSSKVPRSQKKEDAIGESADISEAKKVKPVKIEANGKSAIVHHSTSDWIPHHVEYSHGKQSTLHGDYNAAKAAAEKYVNESADMAVHTQIGKYQKGGVNVGVSKAEFGTQTHLAKLKLASQEKNKINNRDNKFAVKRFHNEETMSAAEKAEREDIVHGMKKSKKDLKARYGKRWKDVMYATATKRAMKEDVSMDEVYKELSELSRDTLKSYVKKASHDVGGLSAAVGRFSDREHAAKDSGDYDTASKNKKIANKAFDKSWKRRDGIAKAVDKL